MSDRLSDGNDRESMSDCHVLRTLEVCVIVMESSSMLSCVIIARMLSVLF